MIGAALADLSSLAAKGFQIEFVSHAKAILAVDFPEALVELEQVLGELTIPIKEIIGSGGGEAKATQRLRRSLAALGWGKTHFEITKSINRVPRESISHEVDHVRSFADGKMIALEIEWNNKDPFFDRDLENFKRLHAEGAISVGIIVTRGNSLQDNMKSLVRRFVEDRNIADFADLEVYGIEPTRRQRDAVTNKMNRQRHPMNFGDAWTEHFVNDKYGTATTHWGKLEDRIRRGVGNPCPLLLLGLPDSIVGFDDEPAAKP
jgi:Restriction endonuclease BglII